MESKYNNASNADNNSAFDNQSDMIPLSEENAPVFVRKQTLKTGRGFGPKTTIKKKETNGIGFKLLDCFQINSHDV
jgi:hypothetical protein